jgi:hypothetical protein
VLERASRASKACRASRTSRVSLVSCVCVCVHGDAGPEEQQEWRVIVMVWEITLMV